MRNICQKPILNHLICYYNNDFLLKNLQGFSFDTFCKTF